MAQDSRLKFEYLMALCLKSMIVCESNGVKTTFLASSFSHITPTSPGSWTNVSVTRQFSFSLSVNEDPPKRRDENKDVKINKAASLKLNIPLLFLGYRKGFGMDVDYVEQQVRNVDKSHDRYSDDK